MSLSKVSSIYSMTEKKKVRNHLSAHTKKFKPRHATEQMLGRCKAKRQLQGYFRTFQTRVSSCCNVLWPSAHLQAEYKVAADTLLSNDILHGAKRGAQVGVEKLSGQQTHRGGHQVVWQGHVCDLEMTKRKHISVNMPIRKSLFYLNTLMTC